MEGSIVAMDSLGVTVIDMVEVTFPGSNPKLVKATLWYPTDVYTAYSGLLREV